MPIMIWLAIIIEFAIQNWIDAGILLGIQFANATLGWCVARTLAGRRALAILAHLHCLWGVGGSLRGSISLLFTHSSFACIRRMLNCAPGERHSPPAATDRTPPRLHPPTLPPSPALVPCRYETTKAADAVSALKAALKPLATCKRDGKWQTMDATILVPGDLVLLAAGAAVPADCIVNEGRIEVDQAALTGESLPVTMYKGDTPKMGSTSACMGGAGWAG